MTMFGLDSLVNASPADMKVLAVGAMCGGLIFSAFAISHTFRKLIFVGVATFILWKLFAAGPQGVLRISSHLLQISQEHLVFLKGLIAGKVASGVIWHGLRSQKRAGQ